LQIIAPSNLNADLAKFAHLNQPHIELPPEETINDFAYLVPNNKSDKHMLIFLLAANGGAPVALMKDLPITNRLEYWYKNYVKENPPPKKEANNLTPQTQATNLVNQPKTKTTEQKQTKAAAHLSSQIGCRNCGLPVAAAITSSSNVFINGKPTLRAGDKVAPYVCSSCTAISVGSSIVEGASSIFINGMPLALTNAKTDDGSVILTGSSNVFAGN